MSGQRLPRTQRAWARYVLSQTKAKLPRFESAAWAQPFALGRGFDTTYDTPVLVVPEAAVKGCGHKDHESLWDGRFGYFDVCKDCGAFRFKGKRWRRPRILRAQP